MRAWPDLRPTWLSSNTGALRNVLPALPPVVRNSQVLKRVIWRWSFQYGDVGAGAFGIPRFWHRLTTVIN
ncbi:hypothetical protein GCM10023214_39580 [Amycolatopsis dongchuanensis]|uniref:Uncharacterized protein n=1 Tax=Amycolatopsis dongchuanensis TaxID=1070866 RepID=A0ABP9QSL0_9PSEU